MSARPIGSATVSFGLVSVPVNLYSASESASRISFNWIHKDCGSRVKQQYVCPQDGTIVERDDLVKGYEIAKGQYVLFSPEELRALDEKATNAVEIVEFVPAEQVERLYLSKVYYLGPAKGGERAYRLLSKAMRETGLSALARYAARGKQYLVLVRPHGEGLAMEQLYYSHELRSFDEVPIGDGEVKDEELKLAVQLIKQAASDEFHPERYEDEVRKRQLELIQDKVDGKDITTAPQEEPQAQIIDLMEALKASIGKTSAAKPAKREARKVSATKKKSAAKKKTRKRKAS
ncbi:MAG: Ku protein [Gemmatimonadales bacterium]